MFKKTHVEEIAAYRQMICDVCESNDVEGKSCMVGGTGPCCRECGCSLKYKIRSLASSCPKGHWMDILSDDEENALEQMLEDSSDGI